MPGKKPKGEEAENIRVLIRCRPLNTKEKDHGFKECVELNIPDGSVTVHHICGDPDRWTFDAVINNTYSQKDIFEMFMQGMMDSVLDGFNSTIFAYGQSGSGKTYTMAGNLEKQELRGIIPRSFDYIFDFIKSKAGPSCKFNVYCSYLELYNGQLRDLLVSNMVGLKIKENKDKTFFVQDLLQPQVKFQGDLLRHMEDGAERRRTASTELNQDSSRSHSIFTVYIQKEETTEDGDVRAVTSKLNLVDLAGSERQSKTGATGDTLKEGCNINLSLSALGTVIDTIVKGKGHIPYRSSPLTMLLKDSLGGGSKTVMFANINPSEHNLSETVSTLRFADRAKQIKNKPLVQMDAKDQKIADLSHKIAELNEKLKKYETGGTQELEADNERLQERVMELEVEVERLKEEQDRTLQEARERVDHANQETEAAKAAAERVGEGQSTLVKEKEFLQKQVEDEANQRTELARIVTAHIKATGGMIAPTVEVLDTHEIEHQLDQLARQKGGGGASAEAVEAALARERERHEHDTEKRLANQRKERERLTELNKQAQDSLEKALQRLEQTKAKADAEKEKRKNIAAERDRAIKEVTETKTKEMDALRGIIKDLEDRLTGHVSGSGSFSGSSPSVAQQQSGVDQAELDNLRRAHAVQVRDLEKALDREMARADSLTRALEPQEGESPDVRAVKEALAIEKKAAADASHRAQDLQNRLLEVEKRKGGGGSSTSSAEVEELKSMGKRLQDNLDDAHTQLKIAQESIASLNAALSAPKEDESEEVKALKKALQAEGERAAGLAKRDEELTKELAKQRKAKGGGGKVAAELERQMKEAAAEHANELAALEERLRQEQSMSSQVTQAMAAPHSDDDPQKAALREALRAMQDKSGEMEKEMEALRDSVKRYKRKANDAKRSAVEATETSGGGSSQGAGAGVVEELKRQHKEAADEHAREVSALEQRLKRAEELARAISEPQAGDDPATAALRESLRAEVAKTEEAKVREEQAAAEVRLLKEELDELRQEQAEKEDSKSEGKPKTTDDKALSALQKKMKEQKREHKREVEALQQQLRKAEEATEKLTQQLTTPQAGDDAATVALREALRVEAAKGEQRRLQQERAEERTRELEFELESAQRTVIASGIAAGMPLSPEPSSTAEHPVEPPAAGSPVAAARRGSRHAGDSKELKRQLKAQGVEQKRALEDLKKRLKKAEAAADRANQQLASQHAGDDSSTAALRDALRTHTTKIEESRLREEKLEAELQSLREQLTESEQQGSGADPEVMAVGSPTSAARAKKTKGSGEGSSKLVAELKKQLRQEKEEHAREVSRLKREAAAAEELTQKLGAPQTGDDAQTAALREALRAEAAKAEAARVREEAATEEARRYREDASAAREEAATIAEQTAVLTPSSSALAGGDAAVVAQSERLERELGLLRTQQDGLRQEATAAAAAKDEALKQADEERQEMAADVTQLKSAVERETQRAQDLESKHGELMKRIEDLEKELADMRQKEAEKDRAAADEKAAVARLKQDSEGAGAQIVSLQKALEDKHKSIQDARDMVAQLQGILKEFHVKEEAWGVEREKIEKDLEGRDAHWREKMSEQDGKSHVLLQKRMAEARKEQKKAVEKKEEEIERLHRKLKKSDQAIQKVKERYDQKLVEHDEMLREFEQHKIRAMERERPADEFADNTDEIRRLVDESRAAKAMQPGQASAARRVVKDTEIGAAAASERDKRGEWFASPAARKFDTVRELAEQQGEHRNSRSPPPEQERRPRKAEALERRVSSPAPEADPTGGPRGKRTPQERAEIAMRRAEGTQKETLERDPAMEDARRRAQRGSREKTPPVPEPVAAPRKVSQLDPGVAERAQRTARNNSSHEERHPVLGEGADPYERRPKNVAQPIQVKPTPRRTEEEEDHPAFRPIPNRDSAASPSRSSVPGQGTLSPVGAPASPPGVAAPAAIPVPDGSPRTRLNPVGGRGPTLVQSVSPAIPEPPRGAAMGLDPVVRPADASSPNMSMAGILHNTGMGQKSTIIPGTFSPSPPPTTQPTTIHPRTMF
eukprot:Hpha_TRINITY_DN15097_c2_g5::TRINITY_DN15097_c2_g5_i1::g.123435::m.123435